MDSLKDFFEKLKKPIGPAGQANASKAPNKKPAENQAALAEIALKAIHDGVVMTNKTGVVQYINPAAVTMTECGSADRAIGLDYSLVIKLESKEGRELSEQENPLAKAMKTNQPLEHAWVALIPLKSGKRIPISISMLPTDGLSQNRIITFRNITAELEEEGEQTEFISTASHEMRTPVATIDGYLSLTLNPQTATIDERARGYLTAAQAASKHLGKLFQDLLDITRLDDGKIRPHFEPVDMNSLVKSISDDYLVRAQEAKINFTFGSRDTATFDPTHRLSQVVYGYVDVNFMREILDNLIENALKYTPAGGSIYVNVRGDGDRVLINVTDTGIGISADDLTHIFQKFYRADNSDTREIGGTGLGLYLVKQRVEAMGGRVWAESGFGEGSTFYVSLPRLTDEEYNKRMIAVQNQQLQPRPTTQSVPTVPTLPAMPGIPGAPVTPGVPAVPTAPAAPVTSTVPATPTMSTTPVTPVTPDNLAAPTASTTPTIPTAPATPPTPPIPQPIMPTIPEPVIPTTPQPATLPTPQPTPATSTTGSAAAPPVSPVAPVAAPSAPTIMPPAPPVASPPQPIAPAAINPTPFPTINNNLNGEAK